MPLTVAVTGADGFIGRVLCTALESRGHVARRIARRDGPGVDRRVVPDLSSATALDGVLAGSEAIIHLAARAHVLHETERDPHAVFRAVNVDSTVRLAEASLRTGLRRFVFVSSIGVNGNSTSGSPFTESDAPAPSEPYAISKFEAERSLREYAARGLEVVVVRPPMVYGAGVKGNFLSLLSLVDSGLPLPLGSVSNRRSLVGVENLSELLVLCVESPAAAGELFLAADPGIHTTPGLLRAIAVAMKRPPRLFRFPVAPLRAAARLVGAGPSFEKLCGSLEVRATKARNLLGWDPAVSFEQGIARTVSWFKERARGAR